MSLYVNKIHKNVGKLQKRVRSTRSRKW